MDKEYTLLNGLPESEKEKVKEIKNYLLSLSSDKNKDEIGRAELLKKYSGNYLFDMIKNSNISGDLMKNLDALIREILLSAKESFDGKCKLIEERCKDYDDLSGICRKTKNGNYPRYRKSCKNSKLTTECQTLHLKFDYNNTKS